MQYTNQPVKLEDCTNAGPGSRAELFLVEGDSAASFVTRLRNAEFQAVLPMQGKPLNAIRATPQKVAAYPLFAALANAIGTGIGDGFHLANVRYAKILLLFDPDADGIHCGALMAMYFYRWMPELLGSGRIEIVRAPVAEILVGPDRPNQFPLSDDEFHAICSRERTARNPHFRIRHHRGLAGIDGTVLHRMCVDPATRVSARLTPHDAEQAIAIFGPSL